MKCIVTGVKMSKWSMPDERTGKIRDGETVELSFIRGVPQSHLVQETREVGLSCGMLAAPLLLAEELFELKLRAGPDVDLVADLDFGTKGKGENKREIIVGGTYLGPSDAFERTNSGLRDTRPPILSADQARAALGNMSADDLAAVLAAFGMKAAAAAPVEVKSDVRPAALPAGSPPRIAPRPVATHAGNGTPAAV